MGRTFPGIFHAQSGEDMRGLFCSKRSEWEGTLVHSFQRNNSGQGACCLHVATVDMSYPNMTNSRIVEHGEGDVILTHAEAVWGEAAVDEGYIEGQTEDAERNTYQYVVRFGFMLDLFVQLAGCLFWKTRMRRCTGYNGLRVGKAKHPGPEGEGGQLAVLTSLIQLLIQMVSKLTGGDADMARLMAKANTTMGSLAAPRPNLEEDRPVRQVTFAEGGGGEAWQATEKPELHTWRHKRPTELGAAGTG